MWNGILAVVIGALQVTALLYIAKKYEEENQRESGWIDRLFYGVSVVLNLLLNYLIFQQQEYNWLMIWNFIAVSTVVWIAGVIDLQCHKIPNQVLLFGIVGRILFLTLTLFFFREEFLLQLLMSVAGGIASLLVMLLLSIISKQGIGYGDVKLYACIGWYLGLLDTYYVLFYAVLIAALYAAYVLLAKKGTRKTRIPFGPFTYLGFALVYLFSFM